ncbi:hypothetical protein [Desulfovibrio sp. 3_1_syn3]|uniref:hypothetical protein n=1 Tax=Desulfovibrio sp. 3_1_syn3 TaxID=457398 RepID=UPI0011CC69C8|nr:hypothetical protein [Desulfovibrio sp. 3_1_syn3]
MNMGIKAVPWLGAVNTPWLFDEKQPFHAACVSKIILFPWQHKNFLRKLTTNDAGRENRRAGIARGDGTGNFFQR